MTMLCFVVFVMISPGLTAVCNLDKCHNVTNDHLESGFNLGTFNGWKGFDLSTVRVVTLTGSALDGCFVKFTTTPIGLDNFKAQMKLHVLANGIKFVSEFTTTEHIADTFMNITPQFTTPKIFDDTIDFGIQHVLSDSIFVKVFMPQSEIQTEELLYDTTNKNMLINTYNIQTMFEGKYTIGGNEYSITRTLKSEGCGDNLRLSLCPCLEPDLTLRHIKTNLTCSAVSIDIEDVQLSWMKKNTSISNRTESRTELTATSTLQNITSTNHTMNYTCIATSQKNSNYRAVRSITIPAINYNPDEEEVTEGGESLWTYIISIIVVGVVVTAGLCFGLVKLIQHCAHSKERRLRNDAVEQNVDMSSEIDLQPLRLDDEPQDVTTSGAIPTYTEVSLRDRTPSEPEMESVYNRLDPRMMTTCREGWRTYRPGEGIVPGTLAAASHTLRVILQPPACNPPPVPGFEQNNFSPTGTEGHYEMQSLRL